MLKEDPHSRPSCSKILCNYSSWSISYEKAANSKNIQKILTKAEECENKFFNNYITEKFDISIDNGFKSFRDIRNNLEFIENVGRGGFGDVYHARAFNKDYAIKKMQKDDDYRNHLTENEFNIIKRLHGDYVTRVFDNWQDEDFYYIRMELCQETLMHFNEKKSVILSGLRLIDYIVSCEILKEIVESLFYLHEHHPKIIHRDIKPHNIFLSYNTPSGRFIKLGDFGLAKIINNDEDNTSGVGTQRFMAPEVNDGEGYDDKIDIYSLGIVAQE